MHIDKDLKTAVRKVLPAWARSFARRCKFFFEWDEWQQQSWGQEGEDLILRRLFSNRLSGFYVDVGAHHPKRFSNTYYFYKLGWRGINIDAMPGSMSEFHRHRPNDINLEIGIALDELDLDYYRFNEPALNGFSKDVSESRHNAENRYEILDIIKVKAQPLSKILDKHLPVGQRIDFISIDVEGYDHEVILSNDWKRYRPKVILIEILGSQYSEIPKTKVGEFLENLNYRVYAKSTNTVFFLSQDWHSEINL